MKALLPLLLALTASAPADHPRTYLASVVALPLKGGESVESFSFQTWGIEFKAVCHIPGGWRIKAGSSATPHGTLEGTGSQGATWFNQSSPKELRNIVLITMYAPVQRTDIRDSGGNSIIPATFKGSAVISTDAGEPTVPLDYRNVKLVAANRCPAT